MFFSNQTMNIFFLLSESLLETLFMVFTSICFGLLLGIPLGSFLFIYKNKKIYKIVNGVINILRSIPYIILIVLLIPITRKIFGSSIGTISATFPLTICAILLIAKCSEESMLTVSKDVIDIGYQASIFKKLVYIIFPESIAIFIKGITGIIINIIGFSAMSGTVGGGGLGDLAVRYGYQRYDLNLVCLIVLTIIILVQTVQYTGNKIYEYITLKKN